MRPLLPVAASVAAQFHSDELFANERADSAKNPLAREEYLRTVVHACMSPVAVMDDSGNILYVSNLWHSTFDYPFAFESLIRHNGRQNEVSDRAAGLDADIREVLSGAIAEFQHEYSGQGASGRRWFKAHAARLNLPGATAPFRVLLSLDESTNARYAEEVVRDLGGRLIAAQEEERSRIARELHDDLSQRMALLSIELEQLAQRIPEAQGDVRQAIRNVCNRSHDVSAEIRRVSHQLHPSSLDYLGLPAAVRGFCDEIGTHHRIAITFLDTGCPEGLSQEVTLCIFRIAQESLRNIVKHSGAPNATVTLSGSERVVSLSVSDSGHGFDTRSVAARKGLGLVSMRERLRAVGGEIQIHSNKRGTEIRVSVALEDKCGARDWQLNETVASPGGGQAVSSLSVAETFKAAAR
jgi:signal transduction histidine kinase